MQIDLSIDELNALIEYLDPDVAPLDALLREKLEETLAEAVELDGLDLNDCGDACKL